VRVHADWEGLAQPVIWYRNRKQNARAENLLPIYLGLVASTYFSDFPADNFH